ncbi:hypothetical protein [Dyella humicola]|uniref:hypothetical protein n=1 Tax=Dyella humicola TaxID=2992126 RepID=UPI0022535E23|nr:hypothetical protein [Dyella humicola]
MTKHNWLARAPVLVENLYAVFSGDFSANYTASLSTGNREAFELQLLDLNIPFSYVKGGAGAMDHPGLAIFQDYAGFRKVIFVSSKRYQQRFSNIRVEQVGNLAEVSLDYQTALQGDQYEGSGWKVMQLIKLNGQWKIASEFFIGYDEK